MAPWRDPAISPIAFWSKDAAGVGQLRNLAPTGVFLATEGAFPSPGESTFLRGQLRDGSRMDLVGTARWSGVRTSDLARGFSVQLESPPESYLRLLEEAELRTPEQNGIRVAPRVQVALPALLERGCDLDACTVTDLSVSGARIQDVVIAIGVDDRLELVLEDGPGALERLRTKGRIVRRDRPGAYGVAFESLTPELVAAITKLYRGLRSTD